MEVVFVTEGEILAGEKYLRENCDEFDDGTPQGTHKNFIVNLLTEIFGHSDIKILEA